MARPRACPACRKPAPPRAGNPWWPFCSERCRLLDLGRWMGEEYRVAGAPAGDVRDVAAENSDEGDDA